MDVVIKNKDENARIRKLIDLDKSLLPTDGGPGFNRLIFSTSPYLLQHAENPVDWYPWGDEAFARAAQEDKPVMLSIGYATCHWCHVMAHESFEDLEVAAVINRCVVPIKVDREERPDIDQLYMTAARVLTGGSAGWPLTLFLTAERKPFYAATYIPKTGSNGVVGFAETVEKLLDAWRTRRNLIDENCAAVMQAFNDAPAPAAADVNHGEILDTSLGTLQGMYDFMYGGFGEKPKFPMPHYLAFLMRMWYRTRSDSHEDLVAVTLRAMRDGGIYDQLGFGFHRYAVDQEWLIPHFEKMLYDQALIAVAYLEGYQAFGGTFMKDTAREILTFVLRDMIAPEGGFFSGLDADTDGREGGFYLWKCGEIEQLLGPDAARLFCHAFGVSEEGNFEGSNILHLPVTFSMVAREHGLTETEFCEKLAGYRIQLLEARAQRTLPFRDEKIITSWNGLMIAALARGAAVCGDQELLAVAAKAADFIVSTLRNDSGRLMRSYHHGAVSVPGFLEDYAFLCWGLIEMYQASGNGEFLANALILAREMAERFEDKERGGFFDTGSDTGDVLVRMKSLYDGAIVSGNSIACYCLLKLGKIVFDDSLLQAGQRCLDASMDNLRQQPVAHLQMVNALDYSLGPDVDITLVGPPNDPAVTVMARVIHQKYIPGLVLRFVREGELDGHSLIDGHAAAYVCARGACRPPVCDPVEFEQLLDTVL